MTVAVLPDAELAVRAWARTLNLGTATGRVFFGVPKDVVSTVGPFVTVTRIIGGPDNYLPVDDAGFQFDVWARSSDRVGASDTARRLVAALVGLAPGTVSGTAVLDGARVISGPSWRPDLAAHLARYQIDASVLIKNV